MRGDSIESFHSSHEIARNEIIVSYIASALFPFLGVPLCLYFLARGRIFHFIGIAIVTVFMFCLWVGFYYRYGSQLNIGSIIS
jgi:lipopolysaccharide export LptBFGC system permease protein LptF